MLQSGFAEQLAKADVLLFIKPERVFITRRSGLLIGLVCRVSVHIHIWLKKGSRLGSDPGLAERAFLSDKPKFVGQKHSSLPSGDGKTPRRRISDRSFENPPLRLLGWVCSQCNITTVSGQKKALGADWSGLKRTLVRKRFTLLYIAAGLIIRATARIAKQVLVQTDTRIFNRVSAQRNERAADRIIIQLFVQI